MRFSRKNIFFLFCLLCYTLSAQEYQQTITIQKDSITIRCEVFLEDPRIEYLLDRDYYFYYLNKIQFNQGGHTGRLLHGNYQEIYASGRLQCQGQFENGLRIGDWKYWHANGNLEKLLAYKSGIKHGDFQEHYQDGTLKRTGRYQDDLLHGKIETYANGELESIARYRKGVITEEEELAMASAPRTSAQTQSQTSSVKPSTTKPPKSTSPSLPKMVDPVAHTGQNRGDLPEAVSNNLARMPQRTVAIFIVGGEEQSPVVSASVKITRHGVSQERPIQTSGFSGSDGVYYLLRDSADYVITVQYPGYKKGSLRINIADSRNNYLLQLQPKVDCGELAGLVSRADLSAGVGTVHLQAFKGGQQIAETYTAPNGKYKICLPCNEVYRVELTKTGFGAYTEKIYLTPSCQEEATQVNFYLQQFGVARNTVATQNQTSPSLSVNPPTSSNNNQSSTAGNTRTTASPANTPPPSMAVTPPSTVPASSDQLPYMVVAGTYAEKTNADMRLAQVQTAGYDDALVEESLDDGLFLVVIGRTTDRGEAARIQQRFRRATQMKSYIRGN